ncbi:MAG TPA: hypothetical protein DEO89_06755 [Lachnospiraceae bacterium]|nr:hypothetical protein [Lachnospiraceae bacterium]
MGQRSLYIGVDLREEYSQLALLVPQGQEPKPVGDPRDEFGETKIPTVVTIPGTKETIGHYLEKIVNDEPLYAAGVETDAVNVLAAYFQKILSFTRREYPEGMIRRLVVTTKYRDFRFVSQIYQALEKLGIGKDRAMVVDRRQCFVYYVLNQKKDLWVNQVGLFDYEDHEITYYQMHMDRYQHPPLVTVSQKEYPDYVKMLEEPGIDISEKPSVVETMVQGALHGQVITSVYMTGKGFADGFADAVMTQLCVGRHVFRGDNLYVFGACFVAREYSGEKKMEPFLYMDEDTIPVNISMQAYTNAKVQEIMLAKAGTPWYQVDYEVDLISDGEDELQIRVSDMRKRSAHTHILTMDGIRGRLDRKARIGLQIRFAGVDKCIFTLRDKGFGNFFPSSHRIWEETIML